MIGPVPTVVLSDLHLGAATKRSIAARPASLAALRERLAGVDHVVLLGDALELREAPVADVLAAAEPFFRALGETLAGGTRVTLVPGNHDHQLAGPLLEELRLAGGALAPDAAIAAPTRGMWALIAGWLGPAELHISYPGIRLRPDVFATHGHYLDLHNTVPTIECLAVSAIERALGGRPAAGRAPADYEAGLAPLYSLVYDLAQTGRLSRRVGGASAAIWRRTGGSDGRPSLPGRVLAGAAIPAAVAAVNRAGLGPFSPELSGAALRRAGLAAIAAVAERLGAGDAHVVFGHTHRSGPWPADDADEWSLAGGGSLTNCGSWVLDEAFSPAGGGINPYSPGTCVLVDDAGPPRVERLLEPAAISRT
jgi:hypothetical protein